MNYERGNRTLNPAIPGQLSSRRAMYECLLKSAVTINVHVHGQDRVQN